MSHFTVLVVGPNPEEQLAPFNEQPEDDSPYLEFQVNMTQEEALKKFKEEGADWGFNKVRDHVTQTDIMKYGITEKGKGAYETHEQHYKTLEKYMDEWHGFEYDADAGGWGYKCNPNAKWDWFQVGGRWRGYYPLKKEVLNKLASAIVNNEDDLLPITRGKSGVFNNEPRHPDGADHMRKGDIDFELMRARARVSANEIYDRLEAITAGIEPPTMTWAELLEKRKAEGKDVDSIRDERRGHPWIKALKESGDDDFKFYLGDAVKDFCILNGGRERFVQQCVDSAPVTFAVLMDGEWYENGSMGWWGMVSDEKDLDDWNREWNKLIDSLPDDTLLSVYDCHI